MSLELIPSHNVICRNLGCPDQDVEKTIGYQKTQAGLLLAPRVLCGGCGDEPNIVPGSRHSGFPSTPDAFAIARGRVRRLEAEIAEASGVLASFYAAEANEQNYGSGSGTMPIPTGRTGGSNEVIIEAFGAPLAEDYIEQGFQTIETPTDDEQ